MLCHILRCSQRSSLALGSHILYGGYPHIISLNKEEHRPNSERIYGYMTMTDEADLSARYYHSAQSRPNLRIEDKV